MKNLTNLSHAKSYAIALMSIALAGAAGIGCSSNAKPAANAGIPLNTSVTEIQPVAAMPSVQPITTMQPVGQPIESSYASSGASNSASSGGTYTVQRGDTLYKIARAKYGDAKQWKKIAAANPEASNGMIKPGQKLVIP